MINKESFSDQDRIIFSLEDIISSDENLHLPSVEEYRMINKRPEDVESWSQSKRLKESSPAIKKGGNLIKFRRSLAQFAKKNRTLLDSNGQIINQVIVEKTPDTLLIFKKKFTPLYEKLLTDVEKSALSAHLTDREAVTKSIKDIKLLFDDSRIMDYCSLLNGRFDLINDPTPKNNAYYEINKGTSLAFLNTYFGKKLMFEDETVYNMGLASVFESINENYLWQMTAQHLPSFFEEKINSRKEILNSAGIEEAVIYYLDNQFENLLNHKDDSLKLFQAVHDLYVRTHGGKYKVGKLTDHISHPLDTKSALSTMVSFTSVENRCEQDIDREISLNSPDGGDIFYSEPIIAQMLAILGYSDLVNRGRLLLHQILNNCKYANKLPNWITVACLNPAQNVGSKENPSFCQGYFNKPFTLNGKNYNTACTHGCKLILPIKEKSKS